jgi:hypothetical protein
MNTSSSQRRKKEGGYGSRAKEVAARTVLKEHKETVTARAADTANHVL